MNEEFVKIEGYDYYTVSNYGRVFSSFSESFRKIKHKPNGYKAIDLCNNGKHKIYHIHRLVATYFIPNPENKPYVNHIDGNKANNNVSNLEWVTGSENMIHAINTGLSDPTIGKAVSQYTLTGGYIATYRTAVEASNITGASCSGIKKSRQSYVKGIYKTSGGYYWRYADISVETKESTLKYE
jgi:hypothetical protein